MNDRPQACPVPTRPDPHLPVASDGARQGTRHTARNAATQVALLLIAACSSPAPTHAVTPAAPIPATATAPGDAALAPDAITGVDARPPPPADARPPPDAAVAPPQPLPAGHPRIMLPSQDARLRADLAAPTPAAQRWRTMVDRQLAGAGDWGVDAWNPALLGQLTGAAKYCAFAVTAIDLQVTTAETAIAAGAAPAVAGDSYLGVGEMIGDLALVYDWCSAAVINQALPTGWAARAPHWIAYGNQAVSNVWHHDVATWGGKEFPWTGWATDDPGDNYYYSFLRATMLLELATSGENLQAPSMLATFRERLTRLTTYMTAEQPDGGSREGTGYGVSLRNLFELYALWQWTTGEDIADLTPHTHATLPTMLHQVLPGGAWVAPTGDLSRDSTAAFFDYHRALLLIDMSLYSGDHIAAAAEGMLTASTVPVMGSSFMYAYDFVFSPPPMAVEDLPLARYVAGIGQLYARTSWVASATWLNLIAGPYTQSHAHQDQGSLMIFRGGWLADDAVRRSKGGVAQGGSLVGLPEAHSLVRISRGGVTIPQRSGTTSKLVALHVGPGYVFAAADLTAAYGGAVELVRRQVLWLQPDVILIQDHVISGADTALTWQLVTPVAPVVTGAMATVTVGSHVMRVFGGPWSAFDFRGNPDFTGGWRLDEVRPGGDVTIETSITLDSTAAIPAVTWLDVGVTFGAVTLGPGIDAL